MRVFLPVALLIMQAQVPLVDLVERPAVRSVGRGGMISGFSTDGPQKPKPAAPLAVKLESISVSPTEPERRIVQITVTNVSEAPYLLPVGRNGDTALKPGNRGRRQLWFCLRSPRRPTDPLWSLGGAATYASLDTADSFLTLPPGGSVRVRFPITVNVFRWKEAGVASLETHAALVDDDLDDNYTDVDYLKRRVDVRSENTLILRLN